MQQQQQQTPQGRRAAVVHVEQPTMMTVQPRGLLPSAMKEHPLKKKQEKGGGRKVNFHDSVGRREDETFPDELPVDFFVQSLKKAPKPTLVPDKLPVDDDYLQTLVAADVSNTTTSPLLEPLSFDNDGEEEEEEEAALLVPDAEPLFDPTVPGTPTVPNKKKQLELQPTPCMTLSAPPPPAKSSSLLSHLQNKKKKKKRTPKAGTSHATVAEEHYILRPTPLSTNTCSRRLGQTILSTLPTNMKKKPPVPPPSTAAAKRTPLENKKKKSKPTAKVASTSRHTTGTAAVERSILLRTPPLLPTIPRLGQRLQKKFSAGVFEGVVDEIWYDNGEKQFHVTYEDDDAEDLDIDQIVMDKSIKWLEY